MTQLETTEGAVAIVCLVQLIHLVRIAASRWLAIGRAVGGFVLVLAMGLLMMLFVPGGLFDKLGATITIAAPIAAVMGAFSVPTRGKK